MREDDTRGDVHRKKVDHLRKFFGRDLRRVRRILRRSVTLPERKKKEQHWQSREFMF